MRGITMFRFRRVAEMNTKLIVVGRAYRVRTGVSSLKGKRPRPLDEGSKELQRRFRVRRVSRVALLPVSDFAVVA